MPKEHKVSQGEHVPGIAEKYGFSDYRSVWNFGPNSELKQSLHRAPNLLFPGDVLSIPDFITKLLDRATDKRHIFKCISPTLLLQVAVHDVNDKPFNTESYTLSIRAGDRERVADADGMTSDPVACEDHEANLRFPEKKLQLRLRIGDLNPLTENPATEEEIAGWQVRLYNLGYFAGFTAGNTKQLRWAVEEFQRDHGWDPDKGKKPTGQMDTETRNKLEQVYGC